MDKNLLQQALADESNNTSSCLAKSLEDEKIEVHAPEQSTAVCQKETVDSDSNRTPELTSIENEHPENTPSTTCMNISRRPGVLLRCCNGNRLGFPSVLCSFQYFLVNNILLCSVHFFFFSF